MVQKPAKLRVVSILTFEHSNRPPTPPSKFAITSGFFLIAPYLSRMRFTLNTPIPVNLPRMRQLCCFSPRYELLVPSVVKTHDLDIAPAPALTGTRTPRRRICPNSKFVCAT